MEGVYSLMLVWNKTNYKGFSLSCDSTVNHTFVDSWDALHAEQCSPNCTFDVFLCLRNKKPAKTTTPIFLTPSTPPPPSSTPSPTPRCDVRDTQPNAVSFAHAHLVRGRLVSSGARARSEAKGTAPRCWNWSAAPKKDGETEGGEKINACIRHRYIGYIRNLFCRTGADKGRTEALETGLLTQCHQRVFAGFA